MVTYVVGDVQGCFEGLIALLDKMAFDPDKDRLWLAGDVVNRGNDSLAVLRYLRSLPRVQMVLGNHDLHALALFHGCLPKHKSHTLDALMSASDAPVLMAWLQQQPLWVEDGQLGAVMTHAGIYPKWSLPEARVFAKEVADMLKSPTHVPLLLEHMYGNAPDVWRDSLQGFERLRFIINAFTRMRYVDAAGTLDFEQTCSPPLMESHLQPWYEQAHPSWQQVRLFFGHWAALQAKSITDRIIALDGGYVWGNAMVGYALEQDQVYRVHASEVELGKD